MSDKMKTKSFLLLVQMAVIALVLLLNGFLFYSMECTNEYLQSRDVWGNTQTVRRADLRLQQQIIQNLPDDNEQSLLYLEKKIRKIEEEKEEEEKRQKQLEKEKRRGGQMPPLSQDAIAEQQETGVVAAAIEDPANYSYIQELVQETVSYEEYIGQIESSAQSMAQTAIFRAGWFVSNITRCQRDFYGLGLLEVTPMLDYGVNACINYRVTDVFAICMAAAFGILLYIFYKNQNYSMVLGEPWTAVKSMGLLAFGIIAMYAANWLLTQRFIDDIGVNVSIQSFSAFRTCPYVIKLYGFLAVWLILKVSAYLLCCLTVVGILTYSGARKYLLLAAAAVLIRLELFFSQYDGTSPVAIFLREINFFSAVNPERFFNRYLNLNIAGSAVSRMAVFIPVWSVTCVLGSFWAVKRLKHFHSQVQQKVQTAYYDEINQRYQETRQMWHDFHNHLLAIQALNDSGDHEGANRYVRELTEQIDHNLLPAKTGCNPVDVLLFKKNQLAVQKAITCRFIVNCSLAETGVSEFDLCSILGNLMDNALEAVSELSGEQRTIELTIKRQNAMLYLSCENPYMGERKQEHGQLVTTKADSARHGIGLSSIRQISKKYRGYVNVQTENQIFFVQVLLNERK